MARKDESTTENTNNGDARNVAQARTFSGIVTFGGSVEATGNAIGDGATVTNYGTDKDDD